MPNTDKIAWIIRSYREARGYSQEYMGDLLDICQSSYANIESGRAGISIDRLIRITEILGIDVHQLIDMTMEINPIPAKEVFHKSSGIPSGTKEVYDQLIHEMRNEIEFLRSLVKQK